MYIHVHCICNIFFLERIRYIFHVKYVQVKYVYIYKYIPEGALRIHAVGEQWKTALAPAQVHSSKAIER